MTSTAYSADLAAPADTTYGNDVVMLFSVMVNSAADAPGAMADDRAPSPRPTVIRGVMPPSRPRTVAVIVSGLPSRTLMEPGVTVIA